MKKLISLFCALALMAWVPPAAHAAGQENQVQAAFHNEQTGRYESPVSSRVVTLTFEGAPMELDVPALIRTVDGDGRTMVPVRPIAEALGAEVLWLQEERQVHILRDEEKLVLTLGSPTALVNGREVSLPGGVSADVARLGEAERTMVPLRFVSEQLGAKVTWDNDAYAAHVTLPEPLPSGRLTAIEADDKAQSVILYLNEAPRYKVTDLGDRVAIDLFDFVMEETPNGRLTPRENPVIDAVRWARHDRSLYPDRSYTTRVVLDLAEGCVFGTHVTVAGDANLYAVVVTTHPPHTGADLPAGPGPDFDPTAFTVALDAGHGGSASGAVYEEIMEKDITLPITLRAAELLEEKGYNVVLTRSEDVYMDLYDRCTVANNMGADIFVSIHANASVTNLDFEGTFTYSYPESVEGERLAGFIQQSVVDAADSIDRGLLTNDYVVLRETYMPAALLETGFMSCHRELERLIQPEYQERLAQGVARGIEAYLATLPSKVR